MEKERMSQDDEIFAPDAPQDGDVPMMVLRGEDLLTETPATLQHPADTPSQHLHSQAPTAHRFPVIVIVR